MNAQFTRHNLIFKQASGTSRGVLTTKETYLLEISENIKPELVQVNSLSDYKDNQYEVLLHKPINHSDIIDNLELMDIPMF